MSLSVLHNTSTWKNGTCPVEVARVTPMASKCRRSKAMDYSYTLLTFIHQILSPRDNAKLSEFFVKKKKLTIMIYQVFIGYNQKGQLGK